MAHRCTTNQPKRDAQGWERSHEPHPSFQPIQDLEPKLRAHFAAFRDAGFSVAEALRRARLLA